MNLSFLLLISSTCFLLRASEVQIYSVPVEYPMPDYAFQVDPETHRARVVLRYGWPDFTVGGDTGPGLNSVPIPIEGLTYDESHRRVIYALDQREIVCATVHARHFLLWSWNAVTPTGNCTVLSRRVPHTIDTGWDLRRRETTDSFFETH